MFCQACSRHVYLQIGEDSSFSFRARFTSTRGSNRHTRAIRNCSTLILLMSILSSRHYRRRPTQAPGAVVHNLMRQDIAIDAEMPLTHRARISRTLTRPSSRRLFRLSPTRMPMLRPYSILASHHRRRSIRDCWKRRLTSEAGRAPSFSRLRPAYFRVIPQGK